MRLTTSKAKVSRFVNQRVFSLSKQEPIRNATKNRYSEFEGGVERLSFHHQGREHVSCVPHTFAKSIAPVSRLARVSMQRILFQPRTFT